MFGPFVALVAAPRWPARLRASGDATGTPTAPKVVQTPAELEALAAEQERYTDLLVTATGLAAGFVGGLLLERGSVPEVPDPPESGEGGR